jgi:hypothetical protein
VNVAKEKAEERIEAVKELYNDSDASKADAAKADAAGEGSPDKQA